MMRTRLVLACCLCFAFGSSVWADDEDSTALLILEGPCNVEAPCPNGGSASCSGVNKCKKWCGQVKCDGVVTQCAQPCCATNITCSDETQFICQNFKKNQCLPSSPGVQCDGACPFGDSGGVTPCTLDPPHPPLCE